MSSASSSIPLRPGRLDVLARGIPRWLTSKPVLRIATLAIVCAGWEAFANASQQKLLIPTFTATLKAVGELIADPAFWNAMLISNQAMVLGFVASVVLGVPIGLLMGRIISLDKIVQPYIAILLVLPVGGLVPILIMSTGIGLTSRVLVVFMFAVIMIAVNSRAGVRGVDPALIEMSQSFGATESQIVRKVLLPSALPAVLAGIRIGIGRAMAGMVIIELLMVASGVGYLIMQFRAFFEADRMYAVVVVLVAEGLVLVAVARAVERRLTPWVARRGIRDVG